MAGVALGDMHLRFAWQASHLRHWAGSGGALGRGLRAVGRAKTPRHMMWPMASGWVDTCNLQRQIVSRWVGLFCWPTSGMGGGPMA